ncbi:terminase small subunit [Melissococcus plutonius]|uniref:terminase small subunit n=1 Tax=Melissococcus plutonius TaxID=33970 RepID=UPI0021E6078A|nr:terminase small subunit [Melissococcus plutonius]MCV2505662.1 terminase small subunit [Melissococcus plutonius]
MEKWELAYKDYERGMKYKDIAAKHDVSINTVKSWKSRKWNAPHKEGATKAEKVAHKKELQPVIKNDDLTEQQKMFCLFYLQHFNATKAYQQAYQCDYKTANANAYLLMVNQGVKKELQQLKAELQQEVYIDVKDLIQEYIKQAFADITDFTEFGQEVVEFNKGSTSFVRLKNADEVDGTLIQEVKKGKDGVSVKLYDKQKAIGELMKYLGGDLLREAQIKKLELETGNKENDSAVISAFDDDIK